MVEKTSYKNDDVASYKWGETFGVQKLLQISPCHTWRREQHLHSFLLTYPFQARYSCLRSEEREKFFLPPSSTALHAFQISLSLSLIPEFHFYPTVMFFQILENLEDRRLQHKEAYLSQYFDPPPPRVQWTKKRTGRAKTDTANPSPSKTTSPAPSKPQSAAERKSVTISLSVAWSWTHTNTP